MGFANEVEGGMVIEAEVGAMPEIAGLVTNTIPFYWLIILKGYF